MHARLEAGRSVPDAVAAYRRDPDVEYAQPRSIYRALAVPDDTLYGQLWRLENTGQAVASGSYTPDMDMDAEAAWDHVRDCGAVVVAVIGTGVSDTHTDLAANMWDGSAAGLPRHGMGVVDGDDGPMDTNGHGTHVAGTIGAVGDNAAGATGVCRGASISPSPTAPECST